MTLWRSLRPLLPVLIVSALLGLILRIIVFVIFPHPGYPDSEYYVTAARQIAAGHGLAFPYLWSFSEVGGGIPAVASLPVPAFGQWLPLASLIQVPFIWLLGPSDLASALPFLLLGGLLGPLAAGIAADLGLSRRAIWAAGLWAATAAGAAVYLAQSDNYALFALLTGGALWLAGRVRAGKTERPILVTLLAGVLAGLAYLSRGDGFLVAGAVVLALRPWGTGAPRDRHLAWTLPLTAALASLAVVAPWLVRQITTFGTFSPSIASGHILFIRNYQEIFSADGPYGLDHLLSWGVGNLVDSRLAAAATATAFLLIICLGLILAPLALLGLRRSRHAALLAPALIWTSVYLVWSIVVAAPHLGSGNFVHSAVAIIPFAAVLAAAGAQRIWDHWGRLTEAGSKAFVVASTVILIATGAFTSAQALPAWAASYDAQSKAAAYIVAHGGGLVESGDPGPYWLIAGLPGIRTPYSDLAVIEAAGRAYGARWLVLDSLRNIPAVEALKGGAKLPGIGPLMATFPGPDGSPAVWIYALPTP